MRKKWEEVAKTVFAATVRALMQDTKRKIREFIRNHVAVNIEQTEEIVDGRSNATLEQINI